MPNKLKLYKDREQARFQRNKQRKRYYGKRNFRQHMNRHPEYTNAEIKIIMNREYSDTVIAKMLNRSVEAIQCKRTRELNKDFNEFTDSLDSK